MQGTNDSSPSVRLTSGSLAINLFGKVSSQKANIV